MVKKSEAFDDLHAHAAVVIGAFPEADLERVGVQRAVARDGAEPLAVRAIDQVGGNKVPGAQGRFEESGFAGNLRRIPQ